MINDFRLQTPFTHFGAYKLKYSDKLSGVHWLRSNLSITPGKVTPPPPPHPQNLIFRVSQNCNMDWIVFIDMHEFI